MQVQIVSDKIQREDLKPKTNGSAGIDLKSCLDESVTLMPFDVWTFPAGIKIAMPPGWVGYVNPRSSTGCRGVWLANVTGVIDSDYREEVMVVIKNTSAESHTVRPLERIAQLIIVPQHMYDVIEFVDELPETKRGTGCFGSTGEWQKI